MQNAFLDISLILIVGTLCATIAKVLRQPMIPAYIIAGALLGPSVFHVIHSGELLESLSTFGIAFLLFLVGIELDLRKFLKMGRIGIVLGFVQMSFSSGIGFILIKLLGFTTTESLFLAIALGFSSTILVLKLLSERKELDTLYGQIVIGLMLTQDFIAVIILIFFNVFVHRDASGAGLGFSLFITFCKGAGLFGIALVTSRYVMTHVFRYFARSSELLFLGSICWCLVFSMLSIQLGFSIEVGSLLAGISLSFLPYSIEIGHRIRSLRDFFLPIFFAVLGGQLVFTGGTDIILPTIFLSLFVLLGSSVIVTLLLLAFGYRSRTSFQVGIAIGQISEFSFVFVSLGYASGIVSQNIVSLVALIGLITMTVSSYAVEYGDRLYTLIRPTLKKLQRNGAHLALEHIPETLSHHVILIGHHTMGYKIRQLMGVLHTQFIVVDHNPEVIHSLKEQGIPHVYGTTGDEEVLEKACISSADYIISTVPTRDEVLRLLDLVQEHHFKAKVIAIAFDVHTALEYYSHGAAFVLHPTLISADYLQQLLLKKMPVSARKQHIAELTHLESIQ